MTSAPFVPSPAAPDLEGQTGVVIGGSAGIGLETARRARAEGADVILTARGPQRLERAADALGARSKSAFDATDPERLDRFVEDLPGPVDHVMVTAGRHPASRSSRRSPPPSRRSSPTSRWSSPPCV